jgi:diaminopimelate epimerase
MKRELRFTKVSPTGNITILVWDDVKRDEHASLANELMSEMHLGAEQVGYVEKPTIPNTIAHLQMMGGEFCGNATRALAFTLVKDNVDGVNIVNNIAKFQLSVSGVSRALSVEVEVDKDNNPLISKVEMPIYENLDKVSDITISNCNTEGNIVSMEGITHIIVDKAKFPFHPEANRYESQLKRLKDEFNLENEEAVGVMWISKNDGSIHMDPVVYVKETNSYYYETSCGSGTVAVALSLAKNNNDAHQEFDIHQPSGGFITAIVERDENSFKKAYIKGGVSIIAEGNTYVSNCSS